MRSHSGSVRPRVDHFLHSSLPPCETKPRVSAPVHRVRRPPPGRPAPRDARADRRRRSTRWRSSVGSRFVRTNRPDKSTSSVIFSATVPTTSGPARTRTPALTASGSRAAYRSDCSATCCGAGVPAHRPRARSLRPGGSSPGTAAARPAPSSTGLSTGGSKPVCPPRDLVHRPCTDLRAGVPSGCRRGNGGPRVRREVAVSTKQPGRTAWLAVRAPQCEIVVTES